jgi:hypothetical protein
MITATLGGITFSSDPTVSAFSINQLDGWFSSPPVGTQTIDRPNADGAFGINQFFRTGRPITITGTFFGSGEDAATYTQYLGLAALQSGGIPSQFSVTDPSGTKSSQVMVYSNGCILNPIVNGIATFTLSLIAFDPVKYGPTTVLSTGTPTSGGGLEYALGDVGGSVGSASGALFYGSLGNLGRVSLTNNGTAAVWPIFNITGGLPGGFYIQCLETGQVVQYSSIVPAGTTITLDMGGETVAINGIAGGDNFLTQLNWFSIPPKSTITVQINPIAGTSGSPTLQASIADGFW